MQTFLPYENFEQSAKVLDRQRLGKQRVEAYQIIKILLQGPYINYHVEDGKKILMWNTSVVHDYPIMRTPWYNHPAVQMWKGCLEYLYRYFKSICTEWKNRGYVDNLLEKAKVYEYHCNQQNKRPWWLGTEKFHNSHRCMLLRKNWEYYCEKFSYDYRVDDYYWPTKQPIGETNGVPEFV